MTVSEYIAEFLISKSVTDVFGIPGGVVLNFLYALEDRKDTINIHLCYHEQGAAFAACGYAQVSGELGVAYATRGPGITNLITGIADAFYDSIPVLFISAHMSEYNKGGMRIGMNQEMDPIPMLSSITKYAARITRTENVRDELAKAHRIATTGRMGPVFLDFSAHIFKEDIGVYNGLACPQKAGYISPSEIAGNIAASLSCSRRPVLLIGDGIRQSNTLVELKTFAEKLGIPVLSSRFAQDIMPKSDFYFGYIGSHATRYSNFILSKTDLIISLGNRLSFPLKSKSYGSFIKSKKLIRLDVDETEFQRKIPNSENYIVNVRDVLPALLNFDMKYETPESWFATCCKIRSLLQEYDLNDATRFVSNILKSITVDTILTSDVGNNEFWLSRAYAAARVGNRMLFSKSFGALGCSLPKAIGAHYATRKPVICFVGDQGLQLNLQELQVIASKRLPIAVVLMNNQSSGMIRSRQKKLFKGHFVHTTLSSGYSNPDFRLIADAYKLPYYCDFVDDRECIENAVQKIEHPFFVEITVDETVDLQPNLPEGNAIEDLVPKLPQELYEQLKGCN